ncbi:MAG: hypothetical protein WD690_03585 [Vicinamibacterales bacterium]
MRRAAAVAIVGIALWLSGAVLAPVTAGPDGGWLAALPSWPALAAAIAAALVLVAWRPPAHLMALLPLIAVALPWMPGVDAGLVYAGPLIVLVWAAVLTLGWGSAAAASIRTCSCATDPWRAAIAAFLIALAWTSIAAWRVAPMRPSGDEPHYLIVTQSLLADGDLRIENNHTQRDYAAYTVGELPPQYLVRGRDGQIYPVHAPGLPALAMPAFAAGGYTGVVIFMILVMALASALVWRIAWLAAGDMGAAWFGWAAVVASCTWTFQSFLVFPDALGAASVACGLWLVLRLDASERAMPRPAAIAAVGLALALLPWLHTRFAVVAAGLGLMIVWRLYRLRPRDIAVFAVAPVAGAAAWFAFFQSIYGTPNPIAQWGGANESQLAWIAGGLSGLLFDQQFGLLPYAPALAAGLAGLLAGTAAGWRRATRLQAAVLVVGAYVAASASYAMWWAGLSVPARLLTVLLPLLAPAGAVVWLRLRHPVARAALAAALGWTIFATASLAFTARGQLAWNARQNKAALWFDWAVPLAGWTDALPAFFRADDLLGRESLPLPIFYGLVLVWIAAIAAAITASAVIAVWLRRRSPASVSVQAITITALVLALPVATVLALRMQGADASAPARAQLAFLSHLAGGTRVVFDLGRRRIVPAGEAIAAMRISLPPSAGAESRGVGPVPAGRYRITANQGGADADVLIGRGQPIASLDHGPIELALPVAVNALIVRGAADRELVLEPAALWPARGRQRALRALRYNAVTAYFVDDRIYAEEQAFWVGGARVATVVLQADPGIRAVPLEVTNGPVQNHVSVLGADQPFSRDLAPGETAIVSVTFDADGVARLQIDARSGFIPAQIDAASQDHRFLGVYIRIKE